VVFNSVAFFNGFCDHLEHQRASTLAYISVVAAQECWAQFEALAWLHSNRELVGLHGGDSERLAYDVLAEVHKIDLWIQEPRGTPDQKGIGIQFKVIHNNKNFRSKVLELRRDISNTRQPPNGFVGANVQNAGIAILVYVRYIKGLEGGYKLLRNENRGSPVTPDEFLNMFRAECASNSNGVSALIPIAGPRRVVLLDGQPYIDPSCIGCAIWLVLLRAK
jgi:hypothetical protein